MNPALPRERVFIGVGFLLSMACFAGCATSSSTSELPPGAVVLKGDQVVTLDAPVGSHIKPHVRANGADQSTIAPTRREVVTNQTDTMIMPPTGAEMNQMLGGGQSGPVGR